MGPDAQYLSAQQPEPPRVVEGAQEAEGLLLEVEEGLLLQEVEVACPQDHGLGALAHGQAPEVLQQNVPQLLFDLALPVVEPLPLVLWQGRQRRGPNVDQESENGQQVDQVHVVHGNHQLVRGHVAQGLVQGDQGNPVQGGDGLSQ